MAQDKLLKGVKIVELSTFIAAPCCGRILRGLGADVIKVEPETGDSNRYLGTNYGCPANDNANPFYDMVNSDKDCIVINLKTTEGVQVLKRLLKNADIFFTNTRTKSLRKLGLDYDSLKGEFPRLIFGEITGYGTEGPDADLPGFDATAFWARSGLSLDMMVEGPSSYPVNVCNGLGDIATGTSLATGLLAALYARDHSSKGDRISVSLYGTAIWQTGITSLMAQEKIGNKFPKNRYETNSAAYKTKDGEWIIPLIVPTYDKHYPALCRAVDHPELIEDSRFATRKSYSKAENKAAFIKTFEEVFAENDIKYYENNLKKEDVPFAVLSHFKDCFNDPQALVNGYISDYKTRGGEIYKMILPPIASESSGQIEAKPAHLVGEDTIQILENSGFSQKEIETLIDNGTVTAK